MVIFGITRLNLHSIHPHCFKMKWVYNKSIYRRSSGAKYVLQTLQLKCRTRTDSLEHSLLDHNKAQFTRSQQSTVYQITTKHKLLYHNQAQFTRSQPSTVYQITTKHSLLDHNQAQFTRSQPSTVYYITAKHSLLDHNKAQLTFKPSQ